MDLSRFLRLPSLGREVLHLGTEFCPCLCWRFDSKELDYLRIPPVARASLGHNTRQLRV